MNKTILSTRLMMPKPRKGTVLRKELFEKLDAAGHRRLTVITGAPGNGKTTLLASYLEFRALAAGWLSLDDECNFISLFWSYVVKALSGPLGTPADEFAIYLQNSRTNLTEMLKVLINALEQAGETYLVFDDFHLLNNRVLLDGIDYFIANLPAHVHVFLLSRELPALALASLEMRGELLVIGDQELRFSRSDGRQFLRATMTLPYSDEELDVLLNKADGWIGGLQLLASSGRRALVRGSAARNNRYINDYIAGEIFDRLNPSEQSFLVLTAPLSYFNRPTAGYIVPDTDYDAMLENLLNHNLMLQCVDETAGIYRYHNLFRDFLLTRFHALEPTIREQVYRKAARVFREIGDNDESLHHLFLLGDYPLAMARILELPNTAVYFYYLGKLPVGVAAGNFDIAFQKFFYHYFIYEFDICDILYNAGIRNVIQDPRYETFYGATIFYREEPYVIREPMPMEQVLTMDTHPLTKALVLTKNAVFLFYKDRFPEALAAVQKSIDYEKQHPSAYIAYFNQTLKTQICEEMGLLNQALAVQEQTQTLLAKNELLLRYHMPTFKVTVAGLYMKQMRLPEAGRTLDECGESVFKRGGQLRLSYDYNVIEYLFLSGSTEEAARMLGTLMATEPYQDILMVASLLRYQFRAGAMTPLMQDRFLDAWQKKEKQERTLNSSLLSARILTGRGEDPRAVAVLDEVLSASRKSESSLKIVEASLLKMSVLQKHSADVRRLTDLFKEAIYYACENRILQPFCMDAEAVAGFHRRYGDRLRAGLSREEGLFYDEMIKHCVTEDAFILSSREQEILKAIAEGLTNANIADKHFISLSTVKTHVASIFRKLNVKSRVMAVDKARQMGIIS